MTAPVIRQFLGTIPDKGQAQTAFDTNVNAFLDWQALQFAPDLVAFGTFAQNTAAALVAANLPSLTGNELDAVRVNAAGDGVEFADVTAAGWAFLAGTTPASWTYATAVATTSGVNFDFNSIPSYANEVELILGRMSLSGTGDFFLQLGDSGGIEDTNYRETYGGSSTAGNSFTGSTSSTGFRLVAGVAARVISGKASLNRLDGNTWILNYNGATEEGTAFTTVGSKTLSATLDRVRFTRTGADTFDAGSLVARWRA